ncbi:MAG: septum formation initiator family protein [Nitrospiraceae bacterium]
MIKRNRGRLGLGRQRQVWEWGVLVGALLVVLLVVSFFFDDMGFPRYWRLRQQVSQLEQDIATLRSSNEQMKIDVDRLRFDPERIEVLAREELGLVRKGETVYHVAPEPPTAGPRVGNK